MADEEALEGSESLEDAPAEETETTETDPTTALEGRIAALETAQKQSVQEIRMAVGRVQSIAAQLTKTSNDPQLETKLRTELAGVSELLGLVTDSIDESILPRDVKQRVSIAQDTIRKAAADAELNRRIAEATANVTPQAQGLDTDAIAAAVEAQIRSLGLNDKDPAFDWPRAASILHTQGEAAMWAYFGDVEKRLLVGGDDEGPVRRTKAAPKAASVSTPKGSLDTFLDKGASLEAKLEEWKKQGINFA